MKPKTLFAVFVAMLAEDLESKMNAFTEKQDWMTIIFMNTSIVVHPVDLELIYITTIAYKIYTT